MPAKKKNIIWKSLLFIVVIALLAIGFVYGYEYWRLRKAHFVHYAQFGIAMPVDYSVHGIDVSRYQDIIDWEEAKQMKVDSIHLSFAFIKATEGLDNTDGNFKRNWKRSKDAGFIRGAYHFFIAGKSGREQAEHFIDEVDLRKGDLPPVLDVEQTYNYPADKLIESLQSWLKITEEYYHAKPIIYTNIDFYNKYLKGKLDGYPLWVAHYLQPSKPRIERDWWFWQHSQTGHVNGVPRNVDFNVFNGDSAAFASVLIR